MNEHATFTIEVICGNVPSCKEKLGIDDVVDYSISSNNVAEQVITVKVDAKNMHNVIKFEDEVRANPNYKMTNCDISFGKSKAVV